MCGDGLAPAQTVWCRDCRTPHHRDCFSYAGKCAVYACGCLRFKEGPRRAGTTWIEVKDVDGNYVPQGSGFQIMDSHTTDIGFFAGDGSMPEKMRDTLNRVCKILGVKDDWRADYTPYPLR